VGDPLRRIPPQRQERTSTRDDQQQWFDEILREYSASLGRLAASYVRDASEREDLLQEIVFAIWRALPRFRGDSSERTFVFRIAHNRAVSHLAKSPPAALAVDDDLAVKDARPDPERALAARQRDARLLDAVRQLPFGYAQVITLTLEGMSYAEISEVLGISETNVGVRLTRSREMLRKLLRSSDERR
jgi:RNA polymerase sigma factor (sigma-70 family)